jgi:hypothetical protein
MFYVLLILHVRVIMLIVCVNACEILSFSEQKNAGQTVQEQSYLYVRREGVI